MHETAVTKKIFETTISHANANQAVRVLGVHIEIGGLSDLEENWMQRFFDYFTKGSIAEGAKLYVTRNPIVIECGKCKKHFEMDFKGIRNLHCPHCGNGTGRVISGKEYIITNIDII